MWGKPGFLFEFLEDLFHLIEHFGAGELGDDEIIGEQRVADGFLGFGLGFRKRWRARFGSFWRRRREESLKGEVGFGAFMAVSLAALI